MGQKEYWAGLYLRLSREDEGTVESASIASQRQLLTHYAQSHGYQIYREYVDDGYSGTSFDRPGFRQMLRDIEAQRINLVLTKDLSRLGRDYITVGQYTERYFPRKGVRYIAVNDGYDSDSLSCDLVPFQHVLNELYARDISKKIRASFQAKFAAGQFIGSFAPYGYQKSPQNKNQLVPDPVAAPVVRWIFQQAALGVPPSQIARELNNREVPSPSLHRIQSQLQMDSTQSIPGGQWTSSTICKLLHSSYYLGQMAQGKTRKTSFKSDTVIALPPKDWVVVEHTHQPLVSPELFSMAEKRLQSRVLRPHGGIQNFFSGIAKCMECGHSMSTAKGKRDGYSLICGNYKLHGRKVCSGHRIHVKTLQELLLTQLCQQLSLSAEKQLALAKDVAIRIQREGDFAAHQEWSRHLNDHIRHADRAIETLYEDRMSGKLSDERFQKLLAYYENQINRAQSQIQRLPRAKDPQLFYQQCLQNLRTFLAPVTLTRELLCLLVERVEIGECWYEKQSDGRKIRHQKIHIVYRFQCPQN